MGVFLFSSRIFFVLLAIQSQCAQDISETGWKEVHVPLYISQPNIADVFTNYGSFIQNLPKIYSTIRRTSTHDILQDRYKGLELSFERSSFQPYLCQDGYEMKGFGIGILLCSRFNRRMEDSFRLGSNDCVRNVRDCGVQNGLLQDLNMESPGSDEKDDNFDDELSAANYTSPYSCVNRNKLTQMIVCTTYGIQGFSEEGFVCASSRSVGENTCIGCMQGKACLSHQFVCGVLILNLYKESARAVICCTDTQRNSFMLPLENARKNGNSASRMLQQNIEEHFVRTLRTTFASVHNTKEGDYGFFFQLCPPDFFVQGYNGRAILCAKEIHQIEVTYEVNEDDECVQKICFPEDNDLSCVSELSPKFWVCEGSFVSAVGLPKEHLACENEELFSNSLHDHGLACDDSGRNVCLNGGIACGLVLKEFGSVWTVSGFVCCFKEKVDTPAADFAIEHKHELLYFLKEIQADGRILTAESVMNKDSLLLNKFVQQNLRLDAVLTDKMEAIYGKKLWALEHGSDDIRIPEVVIMCPSGSYVRGIQSTQQSGQNFRIVCSKKEPIYKNGEVKIIGTELICPSLTISYDFLTCGPNSAGETFQFCADKAYWAPASGISENKCQANPCGVDGGVCGISNVAYPHLPIIICCQVDVTYPDRIPEPEDETSSISNEATKFVLERLAAEFQRQNEGRRGTQPEVLAYFREEHNLARIMSVYGHTDGVSALVNKKLQEGTIVAEALSFLSKEVVKNYWLIDENLDGNNVKGLQAYICPNNSFVRGRTYTNVLCSEKVPLIKKMSIQILGAKSTCRTINNINQDHLYFCKDNIDGLQFCGRGYFGLNSINDRAPICTNGFQCQTDLYSNGRVCGLLMNPGNPSWQKTICCSTIM